MSKVSPSLRFLAERLKAFCPVSIVDVGANPIGGDVPYRPLMTAGVARITGFEPQPEALAQLQAAKSDAETYLPQALGDGNSHDLHIYRNSGFTSIFPPDEASAQLLGFANGMRVVETVPIQTRRMDDLADVTVCDFLKIDVQGSECNIIEHAAAKLAHAVAVQVEMRFFPLYRGEPTFGQVAYVLEAQGFRFFRQQTTKHICLVAGFRQRLKRAAHSQAVDGDAIFVRDLRFVEGWSAEQLARLALVAEGIIGAPDLVLFLLDRLQQRGILGADASEAFFATLPDDMKRAVDRPR